MVKAMAPNAPIGATCTIMRIMPKNTFAMPSITPVICSPSLPSRVMAKPVRIDTSSTCSRSPRASAPKKLSGMIPSRWAMMPSSLARVT